MDFNNADADSNREIDFTLKQPSSFFKFQETKDERSLREGRDELTDYFNYGFNIDSFKLYIHKVRQITSDFTSPESYIQNEFNLRKLFDNIPIDYGGLSNPLDA